MATASSEPRPRALKVRGVDSGAQVCQSDSVLPVALCHMGSQQVTLGQLTTPTVNNSDLPGLLGLSALRQNRAVVDF